MNHTDLALDSRFTVGEVSPYIFGGFLEHMGRSIYEGVYEPQSPHADEDGFRTDVLEALRGLGFTIVRYPGGNFASGYHWEDGVGPKDQRPTVRELAWQSIEPNQMGTDEFIKLCRKLNWEPMLSANLGTGTPEEARNWVEYCNAPSGSRYADMRVANGPTEPHAVKFWCLGNEMDGPWQLGHVPAEQYAVRAQQAAKMMKDLDFSVEMVACGSSFPEMPTFLDWDRTVLEHLGGLADYVSLHRYVGNTDDDTPDFLATGLSVDEQIEAVDAAARFVRGKRKRPKRAYLCFDEYNVWYKARGGDAQDGRGQFAPPLIEEVYNLEDALVVAQFLLSFLRHADVVKIANMAQIVNVIAPILTKGDELLKQSIYYAFQMIAKRGSGVSLRPAVSGATYRTKRFAVVPTLDAAATLDGDRLSVFLVNRDVANELTVRVSFNDILVGVESADILTGPDAKAANSWSEPDALVSEPFAGLAIEDGVASAVLPPLACVAATFRL